MTNSYTFQQLVDTVVTAVGDTSGDYLTRIEEEAAEVMEETVGQPLDLCEDLYYEVIEAAKKVLQN